MKLQVFMTVFLLAALVSVQDIQAQHHKKHSPPKREYRSGMQPAYQQPKSFRQVSGKQARKAIAKQEKQVYRLKKKAIADGFISPSERHHIRKAELRLQKAYAVSGMKKPGRF